MPTSNFETRVDRLERAFDRIIKLQSQLDAARDEYEKARQAIQRKDGYRAWGQVCANRGWCIDHTAYDIC